ncbi:MAG TPA: ATP-binding protein, partial [Candidatus Polarisedimenticolaceae bacterium]|nr:ATP-binding protein [Candidatus Polarisedimenticolaceae bacterium]
RARNDALEKTREFLSRIIEGSAEAIVTLDRHSRIASWNRAAEQIYGWTAEEMIGAGLERLLPAGEATAAEQARIEAEVRGGRTVRDSDSVHVRRDGSPVTVRMTVSPLYAENGEHEGSTAIIRDVTSLVDLERRVREQDRLAAVGRLAAQVAHEIKNPLAGIRGACEVMMTRLEQDSGKEIAAEVVRQIDRLNRTVEDLLLFSRRSSLRPVPSDLHAVIDSVIGVVQGAADARRLEVVRDFSPRIGNVTVDPEQIQQVLFNIIINAAQVMDYAGQMTIRTRLVDHSVVVCVRDSGPGIPPECLTQVFEPFYTTRAQGNGLGLAIVKKIVHSHDGTVEARNHPELGAEFEIRLPYR